MQWGLVVIWGLWLWKGRTEAVRVCMTLGLLLSMGLQLALLAADGLFSLETALPLHLCGLFGVLSIPLLWYASQPLYEASAFLAGPAAFLTLFFPAVIDCSHPRLMAFAFSQLHVLVALTPVFLARTGKPLPLHPRRTLILGSGYLLFICAFNRAFQTNYLFLQAAPANTPLFWLLSHGQTVYILSLLMLCMTAFSWLSGLFVRIEERRSTLSPGNRSSCSPYSRYTAPCTSRGRG